jgi:pimeloyl-ACP methyl ester carboxylesterase
VVNQTVTLGGRTIGFADFGPADGTPVIWCHGGPGSRLEPRVLVGEAAAAGFRMIGVDRPGYGLSPPQPGRTIGGWVPEALAVADRLDIGRFVAAGASTGGAYALALAALAPARVLGVVACCSMTDMRCPECRATMSPPHALAVWDAPDRAAAMAAAVEAHGPDGSKMADMASHLCATDLALFTDPEWVATTRTEMPEMFAFGLEGYTDDRLADGGGWHTFDPGAITCPVIVLHGGSDVIVAVAQAEHTTALVPGAVLRVFDELGHFSIMSELVPALTDVLPRGHT